MARRRKSGQKRLDLAALDKLWKAFQMLFTWLNKRLQGIGALLVQRGSIIWGSLLLLGCVVILFIALVPSTQIFEGNLIVEEMSFTYANPQADKLFLNSIRAVKQLEFSGTQTLRLTGKFISKSNPKLNALNDLTIQLPYSQSKLLIAPADPKTLSKIKLKELRLQPNTQVTQLSYDSFRNQLSFCLQPDGRDLCRQPDSESDNSTKAKPLGQLQLELGQQPLKVILEGYYIKKLDLKDSREEPKPLEFTFTPSRFYQQQWNLIPPTSLYVNLPKLDESNSNQSQWLRGNINVKNVKFSHSDETGNIEDEIISSTILEGKVRMGEKELEIQPAQFLIAKEPGIQRLRSLQIQPKKGLTVRVSGETQRIEAGLDPKFPVASIRANPLAKIGLSQDEIIALLSFCAALSGTLVPWLFEKLTNGESGDTNIVKTTDANGDKGNNPDQGNT